MSIPKKTAFARRLPDLVTEELAAVLSSRSIYEFKDLFEVVHERLRARNAASGGEEMLRLRAYEKLQNLVSRGMVKKDGKKYKGIPKQLATLETMPKPLPPRPVPATAAA
jgi:predicted house-cleaning noncanonical NTP pyrophosphatase (MazG superfamily)